MTQEKPMSNAKPASPKPQSKPAKGQKPKKRDRKPRTIGTNVGQAIREAQERKRAEAAAAMRKIAGGAK